MARYQIRTPSYPSTDSQYMITTPTGVISCAFDSKKLALERFAKCPPDWKLIKMSVIKQDVTPEDHKGVLQLHMSQAIIEAQS